MTKQEKQGIDASDRGAVFTGSDMRSPLLECVATYTRREALADGVLIDAGQMAVESGFRCPVALTAAAWSACIDGPQFEQRGTDEGRLWDVLQVLRFEAQRKGSPGTNEINFSVDVERADGRTRTIGLKGVCGPGDDHEAVVTVMLPRED